MRPVPAQIAAKLSGAASLIAERGLDDSKIEDLATAAGVPKATLYYYFTGKEEILSFLLSEMLHRLTDEVAVATLSPGTAAERLSEVIRAQVMIMGEQPDICAALVGDLGRAARMPEITAMIERAFMEPVERLLDEGIEDGSLVTTPDTRVTATAIFGAIGMTGLSFLVPKQPWNPEVVASSLVGLITGRLSAPIDGEPGKG